MSAYGSFKYGSGTKYGTSSASAPRWSFLVDWDEDGFYDSPNEAEYMTGLVIERGRDYYIGANSDRFEPIQAGRATITLSNHDGRYNPYNTSGALYPNIGNGKFAQIRVRYGSTIYTVFTGIITDIQLTGLNDTARIVLGDGFTLLTQSITSGVYPSLKADAIIGLILSAANWPSFWGTDLGNGADNYAYWWAREDSARDELARLLDSELAIYCIRNDGKFYYRSRQNNPTSVLSLDASQLGKDVVIPLPWEFQRNIVKFTSNPIWSDPPTNVWTAPADFVLQPSETVTFTAEFDDTVILLTDYTVEAFSQSGGAGVSRTADIVISLTNLTATSVQITLYNNSANLDYIHVVTLEGKKANTTKISATANGTGYLTRPNKLDIDLPWNQNPNAPADFSTQMLAFLNASQPFPIITIDTRPDIQFTPDLFDVVSVDLSTIGINTPFRVGKITHEWTKETGQAVTTTFSLEPLRVYGDYWLFDSNAVLDTDILGW